MLHLPVYCGCYDKVTCTCCKQIVKCCPQRQAAVPTDDEDIAAMAVLLKDFAVKLLTEAWLDGLQFLVIWRFFRFWALADGMQVPENMLRCICNNYDIEVVLALAGLLLLADIASVNKGQCPTL